MRTYISTLGLISFTCYYATISVRTSSESPLGHPMGISEEVCCTQVPREEDSNIKFFIERKVWDVVFFSNRRSTIIVQTIDC